MCVFALMLMKTSTAAKESTLCFYQNIYSDLHQSSYQLLLFFFLLWKKSTIGLVMKMQNFFRK